MAKLVAKTFQKYLSIIFKDFGSSNVESHLLRGDVNVRNAYLNEGFLKEVLDSLDFPNLQVEEAMVSQLTMKIPWRKLRKEPVNITIETLRVVVFEPESLERASTNFLEQLTGKSSGANGNSQQSGASKSVNWNFGFRIASGVTVNIANIEVVCRPLVGFGDLRPPPFTLRISDLHLYSTDLDWRPVDLKRAWGNNGAMDVVRIFKEVSIGRIQVLVGSGLSAHEIISLPLIGRLAITLSKRPVNVVSVSAHADVEWLRVSLTMQEDEDLLLFLLALGKSLLRVQEQEALDQKSEHDVDTQEGTNETGEPSGIVDLLEKGADEDEEESAAVPSSQLSENAAYVPGQLEVSGRIGLLKVRLISEMIEDKFSGFDGFEITNVSSTNAILFKATVQALNDAGTSADIYNEDHTNTTFSIQLPSLQINWMHDQMSSLMLVLEIPLSTFKFVFPRPQSPAIGWSLNTTVNNVFVRADIECIFAFYSLLLSPVIKEALQRDPLVVAQILSLPLPFDIDDSEFSVDACVNNTTIAVPVLPVPTSSSDSSMLFFQFSNADVTASTGQKGQKLLEQAMHQASDISSSKELVTPDINIYPRSVKFRAQVNSMRGFSGNLNSVLKSMGSESNPSKVEIMDINDLTVVRHILELPSLPWLAIKPFDLMILGVAALPLTKRAYKSNQTIENSKLASNAKPPKAQVFLALAPVELHLSDSGLVKITHAISSYWDWGLSRRIEEHFLYWMEVGDAVISAWWTLIDHGMLPRAITLPDSISSEVFLTMVVDRVSVDVSGGHSTKENIHKSSSRSMSDPVSDITLRFQLAGITLKLVDESRKGSTMSIELQDLLAGFILDGFKSEISGVKPLLRREPGAMVSRILPPFAKIHVRLDCFESGDKIAVKIDLSHLCAMVSPEFLIYTLQHLVSKDLIAAVKKILSFHTGSELSASVSYAHRLLESRPFTADTRDTTSIDIDISNIVTMILPNLNSAECQEVHSSKVSVKISEFTQMFASNAKTLSNSNIESNSQSSFEQSNVEAILNNIDIGFRMYDVENDTVDFHSIGNPFALSVDAERVRHNGQDWLLRALNFSPPASIALTMSTEQNKLSRDIVKQLYLKSLEARGFIDLFQGSILETMQRESESPRYSVQIPTTSTVDIPEDTLVPRTQRVLSGVEPFRPKSTKDLADLAKASLQNKPTTAAEAVQKRLDLHEAFNVPLSEAIISENNCNVSVSGGQQRGGCLVLFSRSIVFLDVSSQNQQAGFNSSPSDQSFRLQLSFVTKLEKQNTSRIRPNAIFIQLDTGEEFLFSGLDRRDETFKSVSQFWMISKEEALTAMPASVTINDPMVHLAQHLNALKDQASTVTLSVQQIGESLSLTQRLIHRAAEAHKSSSIRTEQAFEDNTSQNTNAAQAVESAISRSMHASDGDHNGAQSTDKELFRGWVWRQDIQSNQPGKRKSSIAAVAGSLKKSIHKEFMDNKGSMSQFMPKALKKKQKNSRYCVIRNDGAAVFLQNESSGEHEAVDAVILAGAAVTLKPDQTGIVAVSGGHTIMDIQPFEPETVFSWLTAAQIASFADRSAIEQKGVRRISVDQTQRPRLPSTGMLSVESMEARSRSRANSVSSVDSASGENRVSTPEIPIQQRSSPCSEGAPPAGVPASPSPGSVTDDNFGTASESNDTSHFPSSASGISNFRKNMISNPGSLGDLDSANRVLLNMMKGVASAGSATEHLLERIALISSAGSQTTRAINEMMQQLKKKDADLERANKEIAVLRSALDKSVRGGQRSANVSPGSSVTDSPQQGNRLAHAPQLDCPDSDLGQITTGEARQRAQRTAKQLKQEVSRGRRASLSSSATVSSDPLLEGVSHTSDGVCGWLHKRQDGMMHKHWKRRWVELVGPQLSVFAVDDTGQLAMKFTVPMRVASVAVQPEMGGLSFTIDVNQKTITDKRVPKRLELAANSNDHILTWVTALKQVASKDQ